MQRHIPRNIIAVLGAAVLAAAIWAVDATVASALVVTGRLVKIADPPDCGIFHFGSVALYEDVRVASGSYDKPRIQVIHGCTELPREEYRRGSGDLVEFKVGDRHKMRLLDASKFEGTVVDTKRMKKADRYFCDHVTLDTEGES